MMHRICDKCLKVESIDFGEMIDDAFYCTECYEEMEKEHDNEQKNKKENENEPNTNKRKR